MSEVVVGGRQTEGSGGGGGRTRPGEAKSTAAAPRCRRPPGRRAPRCGAQAATRLGLERMCMAGADSRAGPTVLRNYLPRVRTAMFRNVPLTQGCGGQRHGVYANVTALQEEKARQCPESVDTGCVPATRYVLDREGEVGLGRSTRTGKTPYNAGRPWQGSLPGNS